MEIKLAKNRVDIDFCKDVILEFRPNLDEANYVDQISEMMAKEGFQLAYIPNSENTRAIAFVGYRTMLMLRTGKIIYIDDLFTATECRSKGHAGLLLDFVAQEAIAAGIKSLHLDSGHTLYPAHRLYLNKGYILACHHFTKNINR